MDPSIGIQYGTNGGSFAAALPRCWAAVQSVAPGQGPGSEPMQRLSCPGPADSGTYGSKQERDEDDGQCSGRTDKRVRADRSAPPLLHQQPRSLHDSDEIWSRDPRMPGGHATPRLMKRDLRRSVIAI